MRPTLTGHERIDQRSIALHAAIARKLEADPRLLAIARDNIDRWWDTDGGSRPSLAEWRAILGRSAAIGAESIAESNEQGLYNVPSLQPGANDFFANQAGQNPPPFKFNQFGGTSQPAARVSRIIRICGLSAAYRRYDISSVIGMNRQPACDFRAEHLEPFGVRAAILGSVESRARNRSGKDSYPSRRSQPLDRTATRYSRQEPSALSAVIARSLEGLAPR